MSIVDEMCERDEFRGLWRSRCLEDSGIETGWSVTFIFEGQYTETKYLLTKEDACQEAINWLCKQSLRMEVV